MIEPGAEPERSQQVLRTVASRLQLRAPDQLGKDDILARIEIRQQVVELIDKAERVAAKLGAPVIVECRRLAAVDPDRPLETAFE